MAHFAEIDENNIVTRVIVVNNNECLDDNGDEVKGPYITDLSLSVGTNGLTTNYNFSTQRKFGDLSKIYEDKIRKNQAETTQALSRLEEKMERVRRGIGQYQDKKQ